MDEISLWSALAVGFLGSLHCVGMCGGISGSLGAAATPGSGLGNKLFIQAAYSCGRIASYALAGFIAGTLGHSLAGLIPAGLNYLRVFAGLMLVLLGLYVSGWWMGLTRLESLGKRFWMRLAPLGKHIVPVNTAPKALLLGALWGWLPCGLVYSALTWSIGSGSGTQGALLMAGFGLGTVPAMVAVGLFAQRLQKVAQSKKVRNAAGLAFILYGLWVAFFNLPFGSHHNHDSHGAHKSDAHNHSTIDDQNSAPVQSEIHPQADAEATQHNHTQRHSHTPQKEHSSHQHHH